MVKLSKNARVGRFFLSTNVWGCELHIVKSCLNLAHVSSRRPHTPHTVYSLIKHVSPEMLQTFDATNL